MTEQHFAKAIALIDAANREDPNMETCDGKEWPKALLYSYRMTDMLERFAPNADEVLKLAVRAQHIQRWKSPRSDYPMDRKGYHQWRAALNEFHARTLAALLARVGYDAAFIGRVELIVGKKLRKTNSGTQLLEDVAGLVFFEHYLAAFAAIHPEYNTAKWNDILRRIRRKLSDRAHQFVLAGHIKLPESMAGLIRQAMNE
ncbi:MAG: DUF4202 domain-containing protein [Burkholderiales bacterium]|nr:DUF4202 domain-containing protein [Nitrosomonas sp.]MCP5273460.1 DUF4202 domain-containing protein [Burkholderiales bacterium]